MTTVGYGNQGPSTTAGRAMVYTFGFFSILAFAGILSTSGYILSKLAEDRMHRLRLHVLTKPWLSCICWGLVYYAWMLISASAAETWKGRRLGDYSFGLRDGYWFSYITSTTVGLGDIYLEPEVFVLSDLFTFPILFLLGFVYLAAFFGHLSTALALRLGTGENESVVEALVSRFSETESCGSYMMARMERVQENRHLQALRNGDVEIAQQQESGFYDAKEEMEDAQSVEDSRTP